MPAKMLPHRHAEQQRRKQRAHKEARVPELSPGRIAGTELEGHGAHDKAEQHQHDGQVEPGERRGIGVREGGEQRTSRREQPHLVAVPHRTDGPAQHRALLVVFRDEGRQHADAQIEPVKHEIARDEHEDEEEPQHA